MSNVEMAERRVGPKVDRKSLEQHLRRNYACTTLHSFKRIPRGLINDVYLARLNKKKYIWKVAVRNNSKKIFYEIELLTRLVGLPVPRLVHTRSGEYLTKYKGHFAFLYPLLPGTERRLFSERMLRQVGNFLGKMHNRGKDFSSKASRTEFYNFSHADLPQILRTCRRLQEPEITTALSYIEKEIPKYFLPAQLPQGAMHVDLKPGNVLFEKGKLRGVIDFDNAYNGPLVFDLANTIAWFASQRGAFNVKAAQSIYRGYTEARALTKKEQSVLVSAIHFALLSHVLIDILYLSKKGLPKPYIMWGIRNLLESEKRIPATLRF